MPSLKPAEFGEVYLHGFWNGSLGCAPSVYLSDYNYGNSFYSFEAGLVHFIFLNPYSPSHGNSKQYLFLINDFAKIDRHQTPWVIVVQHCPMYNSNRAHKNETQTLIMKVNKTHCIFLFLILLFCLIVFFLFTTFYFILFSYSIFSVAILFIRIIWKKYFTKITWIWWYPDTYMRTNDLIRYSTVAYVRMV